MVYLSKGLDCQIPATVEEYFAEGKPEWTYHGVSWFWTSVSVPGDWAGRRIKLSFDETRQRAEVYVNNRLAGYDLISETPWDCDITEYLKFGESNRISVRITNPGGYRGWEDFPGIQWGSYTLPSSHDFSGISGQIRLIAATDAMIRSVFIKNLTPAGSRQINVITEVDNLTKLNGPAIITCEQEPGWQMVRNRFSCETADHLVLS